MTEPSLFLPGQSVARLRMVTRSMVPWVPPGALLHVVRPDRIRLGDLVVFRRDHRPEWVCHRVVWCAGNRLRTAGDAQWSVDRERTLDDVAGRAVALERKGVLLYLDGPTMAPVNLLLGLLLPAVKRLTRRLVD